MSTTIGLAQIAELGARMLTTSAGEIAVVAELKRSVVVDDQNRCHVSLGASGRSAGAVSTEQ